jgi:hypothetical protein
MWFVGFLTYQRDMPQNREPMVWSAYVLRMKWKPRNLPELAGTVVGDVEHLPYRSSKYITEFFEDCELEFVHAGGTRPVWAAKRIEDVLAMPHPTPSVMPDAFLRLICRLLDKGEAEGDDKW